MRAFPGCETAKAEAARGDVVLVIHFRSRAEGGVSVGRPVTLKRSLINHFKVHARNLMNAEVSFRSHAACVQLAEFSCRATQGKSW